MSRADRILQLGLALLVLAHLAAVAAAPGALWGLSHGVTAPRAVWFAASIAALLGLAVLPGLRLPARNAAFPDRRRAALLAAACGSVFWLVRERLHFFGDGYLLVRSRGYSATDERGPVLVRATAWIVRSLEDHAGISMEQALAGLSVVSGVVSVYLLLRLCAALSDRNGTRWLLLACLGTSGALQLFAGHIEYYAVLVPFLLGYLVLAVSALRSRLPSWPTWPWFFLLATLHLSQVALGPAQVWLGWIAWRRGERWRALAALAGGAALAWALLILVGRDPASFLGFSAGGFERYVQPYLDPAHSRHVFGFWTWEHLLAIGNDLALVAPVALFGWPALLGRRGRSADGTRTFLGLASLGALALHAVFNREVGPYRDWDILAPSAFVYLAWFGIALAAQRPEGTRTAARLVLVAGLHHVLPWMAMNAGRTSPLVHLDLVLRDGPWSVYARGYMHEELAIFRRDRGEIEAALRQYEAAVAANPSDARYHLGVADLALRQGDVDRAILEYGESLRLRPTYVPAHNNLAAALAMQGRDLSRARSHAEEAVRLAPENYDVLVTHAYVLTRAGTAAEARQAYEAALRVRPEASRELLPRIEALRRLESRAPSDSLAP